MQSLQMMVRVLLLSLLALALAGCGPKRDGQENPGDGVSGQVGCCQEGPDACSAPATESACLETDGTFHRGKACDIDSGKCEDGPGP
ncbi:MULTISPECIES: hypothetical protein [Microbulbifer]|uniref:hypothetical protein n=1 Tax=Microbulbifer TaxID=48073 RepID=UPI001E2BA30B|nr:MULTISPECIES: hypothetical protein [Microbulbifer]UHQ54103.1 hypothetical protein LVE68_11300 [Microbulbifer sp. YPW16]